VSPLRGEKPQNRPLSKRNTGRFALRAMLPVKNYTTKQYRHSFNGLFPGQPGPAAEWLNHSGF